MQVWSENLAEHCFHKPIIKDTILSFPQRISPVCTLPAFFLDLLAKNIHCATQTACLNRSFHIFKYAAFPELYSIQFIQLNNLLPKYRFSLTDEDYDFILG